MVVADALKEQVLKLGEAFRKKTKEKLQTIICKAWITECRISGDYMNIKELEKFTDSQEKLGIVQYFQNQDCSASPEHN